MTILRAAEVKRVWNPLKGHTDPRKASAHVWATTLTFVSTPVLVCGLLSWGPLPLAPEHMLTALSVLILIPLEWGGPSSVPFPASQALCPAGSCCPEHRIPWGWEPP